MIGGFMMRKCLLFVVFRWGKVWMVREWVFRTLMFIIMSKWRIGVFVMGFYYKVFVLWMVMSMWLKWVMVSVIFVATSLSLCIFICMVNVSVFNVSYVFIVLLMVFGNVGWGVIVLAVMVTWMFFLVNWSVMVCPMFWFVLVMSVTFLSKFIRFLSCFSVW